MALPDVKPHALAYLNQWHAFDRACRGDLQADVQPARLRDLAAHYGVAWNFKTDDKSASHDLWRDAAQAVREITIDGAQGVADAVQKLAVRLGEIVASYSGDEGAKPVLLSAASKFLWFRGYDAVRIYDKNVLKALNGLRKNEARTQRRNKWRLDGDYAAYLAAWEEAYRNKEGEVKQAVAGLVAVMEWSHVLDRGAALEAVRQTWFHERVFDRLLWAYQP